MRRFFLTCLLLFPLAVAAGPFTLNAEDWARPRSGEALVRLPALSGALEAFERQADGVLVIRHSADEAGQLWADELRGWLVALGVSSARIKFDARVDVQGVLLLDVVARENL
jgi:hypothetical protein